MLTLTISIVTANNKKLILDCLRSIYKTTKDLRTEIYVVINASSDNSDEAIKENFPEVNLIINHKKLGFTHNHNKVIKRSKGKYVLVLNDDTVILDGALKRIVDFMETFPDVGILGCKILNPDRSVQWSCGKSFIHKFEYFKAGVLRAFVPFLLERHFRNTKEVSWVTGACLLARYEAIRDVGLFDENITIYYEDGDWCYRMIQAGWKVVFYPKAEIIHYYGQTRKQYLGEDTFIIYQSKLYFFSKHYSCITYDLVRMLTILEVILRYMKTSLHNFASQRAQRQELLGAYRQVIRLALAPNCLEKTAEEKKA
ncbi:MAG: glycosyltransferase [candidate division Zixibacteria bacterium]|nr:glycosyltransferase [candidate division Zixibacteria bacterium]